jgi:hypothetical protein
MLPSPATSAARPDKKKLSLIFPGISSSDAQNDGVNGAGASAGDFSPNPLTPVHAKQTQRRQMIRDGIIVFVSLILSVAFLVFGPAGDFIAGRAFTVRVYSLHFDIFCLYGL